MSVRRVSVRYDAAEGVWMMRCDSCVSAGQSQGWWELSLDNWAPRSGLQKCKACLNLERRKARRQTPEQRRERARSYYWDHRDHRLSWRKNYHAAHRETINAQRRAIYAAKVAAIKAAAHQETLWELAADG
jgi:hypothetical protein